MLPGLAGRYYDADWLPGVDGSQLRYQDEVAVVGLSAFETIHEVRVRVSGLMTPSSWELRKTSLTHPLVDSLLHDPQPSTDSAPYLASSESMLVDEWSELSGLGFFLHKEGDYGSALTASRRPDPPIIRPLSTEQVAFSYELVFETFFTPNLNSAIQFDRLELSRHTRIRTLGPGPTSTQTAMGLIDISEVELIVEGILIPEPSSLALLLGGMLVSRRTKRLV